MYRVLLVDDEYWILEGLKITIDWQAEGFTICGTAKNGLEALDYLQKESPDLALIDIRMPGMNGLDVIRNAMDACPNTHFIIVSGYAEFEYARKGIELNVSGYLLKPVEEEQLLFLVRSVRQQLDAQMIDQEGNELLRDLEKETGYLLQRYPEGCKIALQVGGDINDLPDAMIRLRIKPRHYLIVFGRDHSLSEDSLPDDIEGIGILNYSQGPLFPAIASAELLAYSFFAHHRQHIFTESSGTDFTQEINALYIDIMKHDISSLNEHFSLLKNHANEMSISALFRLCCAFPSSNTIGSIENMIHQFGTAENMISSLENKLNEYSIDDALPLCPTPVDYIQQHFCENISFSDLCAYFSMSATAMHNLLSSQTGTTFSRYLNTLRMEKAKQLLSDDRLSINEISTACGFEDPLYFRKVFKRYHNVTPSEYRQAHQTSARSIY